MKKIELFSDPSAPLHFPDQNTLHLWIVNTDSFSPLTDSLSSEEKNQLNALADPKEKSRFLSRRTFLRSLLSHYLAIPIQKIVYGKGQNGKPFVEKSLLQFSLSHSGKWIAIALSLKDPVGVDIEIVRTLGETEQELLHCFSLEEQAYVKQALKDEKAIRFLEIWNRKEACSKALGLRMNDELFSADYLGAKMTDEWSYLKEQRLWVHSRVHRPIYTLALAYSELS